MVAILSHSEEQTSKKSGTVIGLRVGLLDRLSDGETLMDGLSDGDLLGELVGGKEGGATSLTYPGNVS